MDSIREAIEAGEKRAGGQRALAKVLQCQNTTLNNAKTGRRGLPAYEVAKLADYIGQDPRRLLVLDALDREKDPAIREVMRRLFFSVAVLGGLVLNLTHTSELDAKAEPLTQRVSEWTEDRLSRLKGKFRRSMARHFLRLLGAARSRVQPIAHHQIAAAS
jgi:hypothetical protein